MSSERDRTCPIVSIQAVSKRYEIYERPLDRLKQAFMRGRRQYCREFWALRDVSLEVGRGEALGIIGRNGSGKSTLLQIVAGTLMPTRGRVRVEGRVAALLELGSGFNPEFTGRENVYLNGIILGLSRSEIDERYEEIAAFADIGAYIDQPIKTYSTGMIMRLAFAVQVQVEPDILIVDEALAVGDALFQKRCFEKMENLRSRGVTLLFVSHDQESVRTLTSKAVLLHEGRIRAYGSSADVILEYRRLLHDAEKTWLDNQLRAAQARSKTAAPPPVPGAATAADSASGQRRSDRKEFGDFDGEILDVKVYDGQGRQTAAFHPGEPMVIRIRVRLHRTLDHLNVGLRIRNKEGVKIYSWGTLNQDIAIWSGRAGGQVFWDRTFKAGQEITVDFAATCNLGWNFYEVQASLSQENDRYYNDQRILHWRDEAAFFQVMISRHEYCFGGVCDMRMNACVQE